MTLLAVATLMLLLALREAASNRLRRTHSSQPAIRRWRSVRRWQSLALLLAALAFLPTFLEAPPLPLLDEAHTLLSHTNPFLLIGTALAAAMGMRTAWPELARERQRRHARTQQSSDAARGLNPARVSQQLRSWLKEHGPDYRYRFDLETSAGVANIVIDTEQSRYALYVLPPEHAAQGFVPALQRCAAIANSLNARGIVWIPDNETTEPQRSRDYPVYIVHGAITRVFHLIERNDQTLQRRRQRQQQFQEHIAADTEQAIRQANE
ncbi:MAG: hypothetical protein ACOCZF_02335 [Halorhodospira sp.]